MASRRRQKAAGIPPDELEALSDRNMFRYFKYELEAIGHGSSVKQLPTSVRHRLRRLGLIVDTGHDGLCLTEKGLRLLNEIEEET